MESPPYYMKETQIQPVTNRCLIKIDPANKSDSQYFWRHFILNQIYLQKNDTASLLQCSRALLIPVIAQSMPGATPEKS